MDTNTKPILRFAEENISNTWSEFIQGSLKHLSNKIGQLDPEGLLLDEFDYIIESTYREGFKDGLALCTWLENGAC